MRRYAYGWWMFIRTVVKVRTKRHGAGPQTWSHAFKSAGSVRFLVDGQHRTPMRPAAWMKHLAR